MSYCLGAELAWQDVHGIDMRTVEIRSVMSKFHFLVLALNPNTSSALTRSLSTWSLRRMAAKGRLQIPCEMIDVPAPILYGAIRYFAKRFNPAFEPDWTRHQTLEQAVAYRKELERIEERVNQELVRMVAKLDKLEVAGLQVEDSKLSETEFDQLLTQTVQELGSLNISRNPGQK